MERTTCPKCNTPIDDSHLIRCPKCATIFSEYERNQQIQQELLTTNKEELVRELKKAILKSLIGRIFLGLSIMGVIAGWGLLQIYWGLQTLVTTRIAAQFEEPQIRGTLTEVAQKEASVIIKDSVQASIDQVRKSANQAIQSSEELLRQTKEQLEDLVRDLEEKENIRGWIAIIPSGELIISGWGLGRRSLQAVIPYMSDKYQAISNLTFWILAS